MKSTNLRRSSRLARRADTRGARFSEGNQSENVKYVTGRKCKNKDFVVKCNSARCKTCPNLNVSHKIVSNVSNRTYNAINNEKSMASCNSQNLIYLLTCLNCNQQYVGETTTKLSIRMNTHRTSKSGCEHIINHKKICSGASFSYHIIEKLAGNRYDETNTVDSEITKNVN